MKNCCFQLCIWYQSSKLSYIKTVLIWQYYFFSLANTVRAIYNDSAMHFSQNLFDNNYLSKPNPNYISMQISYFQIPTFDLASLGMSWYLHSEKLPSRCWGFPTCTARGWFNFMQRMLLFDKKMVSRQKWLHRNAPRKIQVAQFRLHHFWSTPPLQPKYPICCTLRTIMTLHALLYSPVPSTQKFNINPY